MKKLTLEEFRARYYPSPYPSETAAEEFKTLHGLDLYHEVDSIIASEYKWYLSLNTTYENARETLSRTTG